MSLNKAMLIGHVGLEPEIRYIDNGSCTARVRLATSTPGYTLANGTQVPERTEWHNLLFWGKLAQVVERYVHKGDKIYAEGSIRTSTFTDKQGRQREKIEIWVNTMEMLTPKAQSQANAPAAQPANQANSQAATPQTPFAPANKTTDDADTCPF